MPTVQATRFTCPECGANLPAGDDVATAKCAYCGTSARLQRRTKVMQRPVKLPPPKADEPTRVARAKREWTVGSVLANAFLGLMTAAVLGGVAFTFYEQWRHDHAVLWRDAETPRLIDADGDGVEDVVGIGAIDNAPQLVAISGRDGHELWHVALADRKDDPHVVAIVGVAVVIADARGTLYAFDPKTGAQRWKSDLPDEVYEFCVNDAPQSFAVEMPNNLYRLVAVATGASTAFTRPRDWECVRAIGSHDDLGGAGGVYLSHGQIESKTLDIQSAFARGNGPHVLAGAHGGGRAIPRLAAVDANGHVLWEHDVADGDPRDVATGPATSIAISDDTVAVLYQRLAPKPEDRLAAFDRLTGARRFDVSALRSGKIAMSPDTIVLAQNACLSAYDAKTGTTKWTYDCDDFAF